MLEEIKDKILLKISAALDNPVSPETLGVMGKIVAQFEENEIRKSKRLDLSDIKNDLLDIVEAMPAAKDKPSKKEAL